MNLKSIKGGAKPKPDLNLSLLSLERSERLSVWTQLSRLMLSSDLTLDHWECLESKRGRRSSQPECKGKA